VETQHSLQNSIDESRNVGPETVEDYCPTSVMDIMLMRPVCFSVYKGAKPSLFMEIIALVV
jgi:hypothetical protein